ncbi:hypothetical protein [Geobacter pickeringii]|uniref:Uncharacterized protein n=1 Tax=Geobacter pickeringii TaxID=345632 RepID=A0A0B5B6D9_9BACT|nr:hypothetical protein [Geobacter pickeringii]AJE02107.1 hypothetical protein GPICK_00790 [Geobacter pickeringii]
MGTSTEQDTCPVCGGTSVETRNQELFCQACGPVGERAAPIHHEHFPHVGQSAAPAAETQRQERAVHHEGFPHVVSEEAEP